MVTPIETRENYLSNDGKFKWVRSRGDESDFLPNWVQKQAKMDHFLRIIHDFEKYQVESTKITPESDHLMYFDLFIWYMDLTYDFEVVFWRI